ncbi:MAG: hypothetical protein OEV37_00490 [Candidatus Berkelbacteria bacterium]|nr:hypothetical protein [Candidatus Berkelbacteria bacterium]
MHQALTKTIEELKSKSRLETDPYEAKIKVNESLSRAAFYYEKLRNVLEYQDEHLFLKNAIKRILKRRTALKEPGLAKKLLHELVWAQYFKNDTLPTRFEEEIDQIIRKYSFIKDHIKSRQPQGKISETILGLLSCEIEEFLSPAKEKIEYAKFVEEILEKNIKIDEKEIPRKTLKIQIQISTYRLLFKADNDQMTYVLLKNYLKFWPEINKEEAKYLSGSYDAIFKEMENEIARGANSEIFKYIKRNIPPLMVLWDIILKSGGSRPEQLESPKIVRDKATLVISSRNKQIRKRVVRSIVRGVFFILLTKIILALILELPYEARYLGQVNYTALVTNITLPPLLMIISGLFIKLPKLDNTKTIINILEDIIVKGELPTRKLLTLKTEKGKTYFLFNLIYILLSLAIISLVVWGLLALKFNVISIILFFLFISFVSFLTFRIRNTARELEVKTTEDSLISGVLSFVLLPFVVIGKYLSDRWSQYNVTLFFWDFIIEAPFKSIIGVFEAWLSFTREKREEFE